MKILIIGTTDKLGGAAKISWNIKTYLESQGHDVSMFVADKRSEDPNVQTIPRVKWRKILGFILSSEDFISTDWILKTKEFKDADLIHCHNLHGQFFNLSTLQKISILKPTIWTLHDEWAITPHCSCTFQTEKIKDGLLVCPSIKTPPRLLWKNTKFLSWRKNNLYKKSKLNIVTPSLWLENRVKKTILNNQKIKTIHNGIDTNTFKPKDRESVRKKLALPLDKKIILFLADSSNKSPWKGWKYAEKIAEKYRNEKDVLFVNIGNHENNHKNHNILYIKHIEDEATISDYYNAADIFLFTSIAENFPLVILEAMACGLPIVSFDVGGVKEVMLHKINGYLAKYRDANSLLDGIEYILSLTKEQKDKIRNDSVNKIKEKFDIKTMLKNYLILYNEVLEK